MTTRTEPGPAGLRASITGIPGVYEQLAGRWLALCLHPIAGWRLTSATERSLILISYFFIGYFIGLLLMFMAT